MLTRSAIIERVNLLEPRVVRIAAPAGYGKSVIARQLACSEPRTAICDCLGADEPITIVKRLVRSIAAWSGPDGDQLLLAAACSDNDRTAWNRILDQVWHADNAPAVLIIENAETLNRSVALRTPFAELFAAPRDGVRVIICAREHVPIPTGRFAAADAILHVDAADLRFSRSEVDAITGADTNQTDLIWSLSDGWPIAVTPLARLIQRNTAKGLAELRHDRGLHELFDYLTQEALTALSPTERDVLEAIALIPNPTKIDIERLGLTNNASGTIRALASNIPFLSVAASGELQVHPLLQEALRHQSHQRREPLIRRLAQRRIAEGERLRGAELFAEIGDGEACASTLDASPLFATTPSPQTIDLVLALDRRILNRHPLLWSMSIMMSRGFGIDKQEWLSEAQRFWEGLGPNDDPALRATIFGTLVNALTNVGDFANADRLCNSFEAGLDSDQISIVAPSIAFWRGVRAVISDQATNLDALEAPLAGLLSNDVTRALWGYEIAAKFFRVTGNRARERSTLATCVE